MESKKINQLATELTPALDDLTIIGDPTTGVSKKITLSQMASLFTGTVEEYANFAAFPLVGVADTIYIALDTNVLYRWNTGTSAYVELSPNIINSLVFSDANGFDGNISLVGSVATLTITTALTQGSVPFIGTSGALTQDNANLFFDDTNNRLGINTNAPTTALDVFGSGIIGRINGTSTNNAYLGFASAGTNKWSVGNVQSDHRFRIFSEANSAELITILQTGEFGIGIANPTTKVHIDGGATALIANLDANVSVAKSISFRSDNSNRINLEVSGTESGSNAGANLFIRRYSDAGALIDTPLTITRSTGLVTIPNLSFTTLTGLVPVANGGTGQTSFNSGYILFGNGTTNIASSSSLSWDDSSKRLGIGTLTPNEKLEISSLGTTTYLRINAIPLTANTEMGGIRFYNINSTGFELARIEAGLGTTNINDGYLKFKVGNAGSFDTAMTILQTTKVEFASNIFSPLANFGTSTTSKATLTLVNGAAGTPSIPSSGNTNSFVSAYISNSNSAYGLLIGSLYNGNTWMQVQRTDGSAGVYDLQLQPNGGRVVTGGNLQVNGSGNVSGNFSAGTIFSQLLSVSTPSGTWTIIGSLPNTSYNYYLMVHARSPSASIGYTSISILLNYYNGASAAQSVTQLRGGSYQVRANAGNIEVYQNSGSTMTTYLDYTYFGQTSNQY